MHTHAIDSGMIEIPATKVKQAFKNKELTAQQRHQYNAKKGAVTDLVSVGYKFSRKVQFDFELKQPDGSVSYQNIIITLDGVDIKKFRKCAFQKKCVKVIGSTSWERAKDGSPKQMMYRIWIDDMDTDLNEISAFKTPI